MRAISTDQRNQIISLLNSGQSVRKVSEKVGVRRIYYNLLNMYIYREKHKYDVVFHS
jgi:hypothetical protein